MDAKLTTVLLGVSAAACFAGAAFIPLPEARAGLLTVGGILVGAITISRPVDARAIRRGRSFEKLERATRGGADKTKIRAVP